MGRKAKKRKPRKPETEYYQVQIDDWEVSYSFIGREKPDPYELEKYGEDMKIQTECLTNTHRDCSQGHR